MFSKVSNQLLPQYHKYNISIDLKPNTLVPWGPIYPISVPKLAALKKYIDKNIKKGYIRPSKFPAAAPIFFCTEEVQ
jgi:hypothetical protein